MADSSENPETVEEDQETAEATETPAEVTETPVEATGQEQTLPSQVPADRWAEVASQLEQTQQGIQQLHDRLDRQLAESASCSKEAFDRLYEEMRQYKDNFLLSAQRPLLTDVMLLYDSILKLSRHYEQVETVDPRSLLDNLEGLLVEAEEILARREVLPIREPSDKLVLRTQKAIKTMPTSSEDEDMEIVERVKTGFMLGETVFRREEVVVKKYKPAAPPEEQAPNERPSTG